MSWEEMRATITAIEGFLAAHTRLPERAELTRILEGYFYAYTHGDDNTPVPGYPGREGTLAPDVQASYERFLRENRSSRYYTFMQKLYRMYRENSFRQTEEIREFLVPPIPNR